MDGGFAIVVTPPNMSVLPPFLEEAAVGALAAAGDARAEGR